jgi:hypothetical protein
MPAISNKTKQPLSVPLPGGKTLHLGPGQTGQISASAVDTAALKKLIEAGEIELVPEDSHYGGGAGGGRRGRAGYGQASTGIRRTGNR